MKKILPLFLLCLIVSMPSVAQEIIAVQDSYLRISEDKLNGYSTIHKFGHNATVATTFVPIASGGVYNTPQVSGATTLRIKAGGNANDTAAGTGAREITIQGIDSTGALISETLTTAGASASSVTTLSFLRVFRVWVSASGSYANATTPSHSASIVIENGAGGTDWATIENGDFAKAQSEIAAYTVPLGYTAYVGSIFIAVESNKAAEVLFFQRENILETAAPYTAMRSTFALGSILGELSLKPKSLLGGFPELTDIGFMAKVPSGTADIDVDFEIILVQND